MIRQREPIPRLSEKKAKSGRPYLKRSAIKRSTKPIRKVNPKAKAKRVIGYRKMLASKEYKAARAEAMERAGDRCEATIDVYDTSCGKITRVYTQRCAWRWDLHAHHLRYPKVRPLAASDLKILCKHHHEQAESLKPHKTRMF